jgi:hypothetical protein
MNLADLPQITNVNDLIKAKQRILLSKLHSISERRKNPANYDVMAEIASKEKIEHVCNHAIGRVNKKINIEDIELNDIEKDIVACFLYDNL